MKNSKFMLIAGISIVLYFLGCSPKITTNQLEFTHERMTTLEHQEVYDFEEEGVSQEPATTYYNRLSIAFDGDSTCIGMKNDMNFPEWYSGCFYNNNNRLTINVIGDTVEIRKMLVDLLGGDEFDLGIGVCNKSTQLQTKKLLHEAIEKSKLKQDLGISAEADGSIEIMLTGDSINAVDRFKKEVFDSPILRFKITEKIGIILL